MRILIAGSSVAAYVRPRVAGARAYGHLLRELLASRRGVPVVELELRAENSLTVVDLVRDFEEHLVASAPDVVIFHVGIVECTPRAIPQGIRRRFVRGRTRAERLLLAGEATVRRPVLRLLGGATAMSESAFEAALTRLVQVAHGDAGARVLCLGIHPTTDRVRREAPAIDRKIAAFDQAIRLACQAGGGIYVDVGAMVAKLGVDAASPDGIHFSAEGHTALAHRLLELVDQPAQESALAAGPAPAVPSRRGVPAVVAVVPAFFMGLFALLTIPAIRLWRAAGRLGRR